MLVQKCRVAAWEETGRIYANCTLNHLVGLRVGADSFSAQGTGNVTDQKVRLPLDRSPFPLDGEVIARRAEFSISLIMECESGKTDCLTFTSTEAEVLRLREKGDRRTVADGLFVTTSMLCLIFPVALCLS
jgi:hypothetical protein